MNNIHIISFHRTLLEALQQINTIKEGPLVLFVVNDDDCMVGTLTDGDSRRALINGASIANSIEHVMQRNFNFLRKGINDDVRSIQGQKELKMRLVPILDRDNRIVEIINLEKYVTKLPVDAVLMAGGKGERLRPLTENTPKPLLKVGDKAIIDYNVERLISYGVNNINVTVNYLKEQLEEHFSEPKLGVQIHTVREPKFLGTMGSIQFVENFYNDTVLMMNSDLFTNIDYEEFYLHFEKYNADMSIATAPYSISVPYGIFELEGREVRRILEKPTYNYYVNAGIYLIKKEILDKYVPRNVFFNATDFMEKLIEEKRKVIRYPLSGYWIDIGNKQEYDKAQSLAKHLK